MVSIGSVALENPFILAPMAGIGDPPFRRLCRRGGAGLVCAEMVSSNALYYDDKKSERMLTTYPDEHPVSLQIFGNDPERLALAAQKAEAAGADIVDLNCGCPVPKITKTGAGISLMKDEKIFTRCLEAMVKAVKIPVTVKMRLGFVKGENHAVRFTRIAATAGVKAVFLHARAQEDRHDGPPNLDGLRETVASVNIPVFGNGGVNSYADARRMMDETGCAGVLIGQAAVGNPLIFLEMLRESETTPSPVPSSRPRRLMKGRDDTDDSSMGMTVSGRSVPRGKGNAFPSPLGRMWAEGPDEGGHQRENKGTSIKSRRFDLLREHARLITEYYGEDLGVRRLRKYVPAYVKGLPGAAEFRNQAISARYLVDLLALVDRFEAALTLQNSL